MEMNKQEWLESWSKRGGGFKGARCARIASGD
jgi:hypothetical protein